MAHKASLYPDISGDHFGSLLEVRAAANRLIKTVKPRKVVIVFENDHVKLQDPDSNAALHRIPLDTVEPLVCDKTLWVLSTVNSVGSTVCHVLSTKKKASVLDQELQALITAFFEALHEPVAISQPDPTSSRILANRLSTLRRAEAGGGAFGKQPTYLNPTPAPTLINPAPAVQSGPELNPNNPHHDGARDTTQGPRLLQAPAVPAFGSGSLKSGSLSNMLMGLPGTHSARQSHTIASSKPGALQPHARANSAPILSTSSTASTQGGAGWRRKFDAVLLGSELAECASLEGFREALAAWESSKGGTSKAKAGKVGEPVLLIVSSTSVTLEERGSGETILETFIKHVTFTAAQPRFLGPKHDLLCYMVKDPHLGSLKCMLMQVDVGDGAEISRCIRAAFDEQRKEEELNARRNPFAVVDQAREAAPPELRSLQIHRADLAAIECIGSGQFGSVYIAKQRVQMGRGDHGSALRSRAVKLLKNGASVKDKDNFRTEAIVMQELQHPNIVRLIGVAVQQRPWLVVLEYMYFGDLLALVKGCRERNILLHPGEMLFYGQQFASGCAFISSKGFVHMDLACRNALVTHNNILKVADFGLARKFTPGLDHLVLSEGMKLPLRWVSVEGFIEKRFSEKSDVWSFGVALWEMFSHGALPYTAIKTAEVPRAIVRGQRLPRPTDCPEDVFKVMASCWLPDYNNRPTFAQLRDLQSTLLEAHLPQFFRDIGLLLRESKGKSTSGGGARAQHPPAPPPSPNERPGPSGAASAGAPSSPDIVSLPASPWGNDSEWVGSGRKDGARASYMVDRPIPPLCELCGANLRAMSVATAAIHLRICEINQEEAAAATPNPGPAAATTTASEDGSARPSASPSRRSSPPPGSQPADNPNAAPSEPAVRDSFTAAAADDDSDPAATKASPAQPHPSMLSSSSTPQPFQPRPIHSQPVQLSLAAGQPRPSVLSQSSAQVTVRPTGADASTASQPHPVVLSAPPAQPRLSMLSMGSSTVTATATTTTTTSSPPTRVRGLLASMRTAVPATPAPVITELEARLQARRARDAGGQH